MLDSTDRLSPSIKTHDFPGTPAIPPQEIMLDSTDRLSPSIKTHDFPGTPVKTALTGR